MSTALADTLAAKLKANPSIKTAMLAETLGLSEAELLRNWPIEGEVAELEAARAEALIQQLEDLGTVYVVVRNAGCVSESYGEFGGFSRSGPFLNVATDTLHLHIKVGEIGAVFALDRPGRDASSRSRSIQFFGRDGAAIFKVFLMRPPGAPPFERDAYARFLREAAMPA